ncbi:hypothetical protein WA158_007656 [Blastocystis sp. Blastoise]
MFTLVNGLLTCDKSVIHLSEYPYEWSVHCSSDELLNIDTSLPSFLSFHNNTLYGTSYDHPFHRTITVSDAKNSFSILITNQIKEGSVLPKEDQLILYNDIPINRFYCIFPEDAVHFTISPSLPSQLLFNSDYGYFLGNTHLLSHQCEIFTITHDSTTCSFNLCNEGSDKLEYSSVRVYTYNSLVTNHNILLHTWLLYHKADAIHSQPCVINDNNGIYFYDYKDILNNLDITPTSNVTYSFEGYFHLSSPSLYTFTLITSYSASLYINNKLVIAYVRSKDILYKQKKLVSEPIYLESTVPYLIMYSGGYVDIEEDYRNIENNQKNIESIPYYTTSNITEPCLTIEYDANPFRYTYTSAQYQMYNVIPSNTPVDDTLEYTNCTSTPSLPEGITLSGSMIRGSPMEEQPFTPYIISCFVDQYQVYTTIYIKIIYGYYPSNDIPPLPFIEPVSTYMLLSPFKLPTNPLYSGIFHYIDYPRLPSQMSCVFLCETFSGSFDSVGEYVYRRFYGNKTVLIPLTMAIHVYDPFQCSNSSHVYASLYIPHILPTETITLSDSIHTYSFSSSSFTQDITSPFCVDPLTISIYYQNTQLTKTITTLYITTETSMIATVEIPVGIKEYEVKIQNQIIIRKYQPIQLFNENTIPEGNWRDIQYDDSLWNTVPFSTPQDFVGNTIYLRYPFDLVLSNDILEIVYEFYNQFGYVLYLNGQEIRREFISNSTVVDYNTHSIGFNNDTCYAVGSILPGSLSTSHNVLSFEIHRAINITNVFGPITYIDQVIIPTTPYAPQNYTQYGHTLYDSTYPVHIFTDLSIKAIYTHNILKSYSGYTNQAYKSLFSISSLSSSKPSLELSSSSSLPLQIPYSFSIYHHEYINKIVIKLSSVVSSNTRAVPEHIQFQGSNNNIDWDLVYTIQKKGYFESDSNEFTLWIDKQHQDYQYYKLIILSTNIPLSETVHLSISFIGFYSSTHAMCPQEQGWNSIPIGETTFTLCPDGFKGYITRQCIEDTQQGIASWNNIDDSSCMSTLPPYFTSYLDATLVIHNLLPSIYSLYVSPYINQLFVQLLNIPTNQIHISQIIDCSIDTESRTCLVIRLSPSQSVSRNYIDIINNNVSKLTSLLLEILPYPTEPSAAVTNPPFTKGSLRVTILHPFTLSDLNDDDYIMKKINGYNNIESSNYLLSEPFAHDSSRQKESMEINMVTMKQPHSPF